nr:MAG TPA: tail fiber protein [Caudoviricetes sp.]
MATKWKKTYTDISNVNGGNEYETGDHITKETVNVALNNTAYLQQTKVTAESNKGLVTQRFLDGVDLNTITTNGFYGCNGACTNKPNEDRPGQMIVINRGDNWIGQFYINMNQGSKATSNRVHTRGYDNSNKAWSSWKQIDNDPSLYNLGAYDTYVDNGDGTTTITRQTGYWNSNNAAVNVAKSYHYTNGMRVQYDKVSNIDSGEGEGKAKSNWAYGFEMISKPSNINYNSTAIWLGFPYIFVNGKADLTSALEYINKNPVSIEYKLATPYTETIITGVPQITLDKQGCEWLRSEWEKGLNLLEIEDVGSTTLNGITYSISNGVVTLNGTPTANLDIVLGTINLEQGNYTYRSFATLINGSLMTLATDINGNMDLLQQSNDIDYVSQVLTNDIYTFKLRISTSCPTLTNVTVKPMLVKGSVPYPYQPYNSAYHITNNQADLLKKEYDLSCNLFETQMVIKLTAGSEQWRNRKIKNLVVGKTYTLYGFDNNTYQGHTYQALPEYKEFKNRAYTFVASAETKEIRVGANTLSQNLDFITQIMLIEGTAKPSKFIPYNSSKHITNPQADLLSDEEELSRNLLIENFYKYNDNYRMNLGYCELKANTTYCLSTSSNITSRILIVVGSQENVLTTYSFTNKLAFTPTQDYKGNLVLQGTFTNIALPTWAILNKGSEPLPYTPYNGSIIHEKQLSLQAPSMGHKTANECMMNVTGEYYNNSSSDKYILLGDITQPAFDNDGGFIINGTIGDYFYTAQAQINAVAYQRGGVKWKGSYTQDKTDGAFNTISDLIITSTKKVYVEIKAGQYGQYNLQLQGKTIKYTGDVLDTIDGSIASTFSQSDAIDLTALNNNANKTITDGDVDTSDSMQGVYEPFDVGGDGFTYADQNEVNSDFYKAIRALRNRNLYHTTITHGYNTTSYGQNTGEFFEVTIFTSDDKTSYNTAGTAWTILRDYLNNNGYTLGNVANWITSNRVYPCNGQLLKYSSSGSVSLTYNIYGVSYNNGKFYVHYYTNTNAYGTSELSYPDSYWRVKSTKIF